MDVTDVAGFIRRSALLVAIAALVGMWLGAIAFAVQPAEYRATAQVLVSTDSAATTSEIVQGGDFVVARVETYAQLVGSELVLDPVIAQLDLDDTASELAGRVEGAVVPSTTLIEIRVDAGDPDEAAAIADATAVSLQAAVDTIESTPQAASPVALTVTENASPPTEATSPRLLTTVGVGLALGLLAGVALALVRANADPRIQSEHDLRRLVDVPVLGRIGEIPDDAVGRVQEAFRSLRTSLRTADLPAGGRAVLVASVGDGSDRDATVTTLNLATVLAHSGERVLVVDADLRGGPMAPSLGLVGDIGLRDVLAGRSTLDDAARPWHDTAVAVLPAGTGAANPSELLESASMVALLEAARSTYDWVLLDAPALPDVTDAAVLAPHADGVLVVVHARRTRPRDLTLALETLERTGSRLLGFVLMAAQREAPGTHRMAAVASRMTASVARLRRRPEAPAAGAASTLATAERIPEPAAQPTAAQAEEAAEAAPEQAATAPASQTARATVPTKASPRAKATVRPRAATAPAAAPTTAPGSTTATSSKAATSKPSASGKTATSTKTSKARPSVSTSAQPAAQAAASAAPAGAIAESTD